MGSALSKNEACLVWCGMEDDSYPAAPRVLNDDDPTVSLTEDVDAFGREVCRPYPQNRFGTPVLTSLPQYRRSVLDKTLQESLSRSTLQAEKGFSDCFLSRCRKSRVKPALPQHRTDDRHMIGTRHMICHVDIKGWVAGFYIPDFRCTKDQ